MYVHFTFLLTPYEIKRFNVSLDPSIRQIPLQLEQKKYGGQLWKFKDLVKQEGMLVLYRGSQLGFCSVFRKPRYDFTR